MKNAVLISDIKLWLAHGKHTLVLSVLLSLILLIVSSLVHVRLYWVSIGWDNQTWYFQIHDNITLFVIIMAIIASVIRASRIICSEWMPIHQGLTIASVSFLLFIGVNILARVFMGGGYEGWNIVSSIMIAIFMLAYLFSATRSISHYKKADSLSK